MNLPKLPYYHIKHLIAEGGTASIFWGIDLRSGYPVAIKELKIKHIKNKIIKDNFRNFETQLYVYLHYPKPHPNLPRLKDFIEIPETGQLYLVMDFIQGRDLERYIYKEIGLIPEQKALPMFLEILDTVAYLHNCKIPALGIKNGLLHLDIKPNNIMLLPDGKIKLIDLGIASRMTEACETTTGNGYGTLRYMPSEQFEKKNCGKYTDVYALGVLLFEMLTGRLPFDHSSREVLINMIKFSPVPQMRSCYPMIGEELQYIVERAMAKDPKNRFQSCEEFALCIKDYMKRKNKISYENNKNW